VWCGDSRPCVDCRGSEITSVGLHYFPAQRPSPRGPPAPPGEMMLVRSMGPPGPAAAGGRAEAPIPGPPRPSGSGFPMLRDIRLFMLFMPPVAMGPMPDMPPIDGPPIGSPIGMPPIPPIPSTH